MRKFTRKRYSVSERVKKTGILAMTHLNTWLVIAFISSTASCVIGYNAQCCKNASVSGSAPASERRCEFSSWYDVLKVLFTGVIVLNIENIILLFFVFWKLHSKSTWLKNLRGHVPLTLNGHDASNPHCCGDGLPHIHFKTLDSSALKPCWCTSHGKQDNSTSNLQFQVFKQRWRQRGKTYGLQL